MRSSRLLIQAGEPQVSVVGSTLYLIYTCNPSKSSETTVETVPDDTDLLATSDNPTQVIFNLQNHMNFLKPGLEKFVVKVNENKF